MRTHLLGAALLAALPAFAQGTLPHSLAGHWGEADLVLPWGRVSSRWQQLCDRAELPPTLTAGRQLTHLGVRRLAQGVAVPAISLDTEIAIYDTLMQAGALGANFAANRGTGSGGVAFARRVTSLPATPLLDPDGSAHLLPLDAPRTFTGPNLLVEIVNRSTGPSYTGWYPNAAQSYGPDGFPTDLGAKCGNFLNMMLSSGPYRPGATFRVTEFYSSGSPVPINVLGVSPAISLFGPLPIDLTSLGAPGCVVRASFELLTPGGGAPGFNVDYPVPAVGAFSGVKLYTQWLNADAAANALGITVSGARVISLGSRSYAMAHTERENDSLDTTGTGPHRGGGSVLVVKFL
jgi:hypothetical protein